MADNKDVTRLGIRLHKYLINLFRRVGYPEEEADKKVKLKGNRVSFDYGNVAYYIEVYSVPGPEIRFFVERDSSNGLMKKVNKSGKSLKDIVLEELNKQKTATQLIKQHGYIDDRRVECEKDYIKVDCRVKRIPEAGKENLLYDSIIGDLMRPLVGLG